MDVSIEDLGAAADRLRGHLVRTPLVGGVQLPGVARDGLVLKLELLQPGASAWFRGYLHWSLRQMGRSKGLRFDPGVPGEAAAREVARLQRLPIAGLRDDGEARGFAELPGLDDPDVFVGTATLGQELAETLGSGVEALFVDAGFAPAVEAGLRAAGSDLAVRAVPCGSAPELVDPLAAAVRVVARPEELASLQAACADSAETVCCVV